MKKSMPQIEIERISSDIIRAFSGDTIPEQIDIDSLVKDYLGYAIIYEHFADKSRQGFTSDGITTLSIIRDDCVKDFVFPSNTIVIDSYYRDGKHEEQRRFILAHEVGHIINNRVQGKNDAHYFTDSGSYANSSSFLHIKENMSYEETVANRYAAALLMPDFVVSNLIKKHHGGKKFKLYNQCIFLPEDRRCLTIFTKILKVSYSALYYRLRDLGAFEDCVDSDYLRRLNLGGANSGKKL